MPGSGNDYVVLEILAIQGRNLPNKDFFKKQDPFLQFSIEKSSHKTKVDKNGGTRPEWNSRIRFERLPTPVNDMMKIKCLDSEWKREPQFIGECAIDLAPVFVRGEEDGWFKLTAKGEPAGEIYLELTFFTEDGLTRRQSKIGEVGPPVSVPSSHSKPLPEPILASGATQSGTSIRLGHEPKPLPEIKVQKTHSANHTPSASISSVNAASSSWSLPGSLHSTSPTNSSMVSGQSAFKPDGNAVGPGTESFHSISQPEESQSKISSGNLTGHALGNSAGNETQVVHSASIYENLDAVHEAKMTQPQSMQPVSNPPNADIESSHAGSSSGQENSIAQSLEKVSLDQMTSSLSPAKESENQLDPKETVAKLSPKKKMTIEAILGRRQSTSPPKSPVSADKPNLRLSNAKAQLEQKIETPQADIHSESASVTSQSSSRPAIVAEVPSANTHQEARPAQQTHETTSDTLQATPSGYSSTTANQQEASLSYAPAGGSTHSASGKHSQASTGAQQVNTPIQQEASHASAPHHYSLSYAYGNAPLPPEAVSSAPPAHAQPGKYHQDAAYAVPSQPHPTTSGISSNYVQANNVYYPTHMTNHHGSMSYGSSSSYHQALPGPEVPIYQPPPEVPYPPSLFHPRPPFQGTPYPNFSVGGFAFANQGTSQYPTEAAFPNHLNYIPQHSPQTFPNQPLPPPLPTKPQDMPLHYIHDLPPPLPSRISTPPTVPSYCPPPPSHPTASQNVPVLNPNNYKPSSSSTSSTEGKRKKKGRLGFLFS